MLGVAGEMVYIEVGSSFMALAQIGGGARGEGANCITTMGGGWGGGKGAICIWVVVVS